MEKNIDYYLNLPYTMELIYDPEHDWFIRVKELPGCTSQGETPDEAVLMIKDAMQLWIEDALEQNISIPEPRPEENYSGRFNLRVPTSLHRKLVELADEEGVSLNTLCISALSEAAGQAVVSQKPHGHTSPAEPMSSPSVSSWPGLSAGARRTLMAAGHENEAGIADERLFAEWAVHNLASIESAFAEGYYRDALMELENFAHVVRIGASHSPALKVMNKSLKFIHDLIETSCRLERSEVDLQMFARQAIQEVYHSAQEKMKSETRKMYSEAATRTESILADELFKFR